MKQLFKKDMEKLRRQHLAEKWALKTLYELEALRHGICPKCQKRPLIPGEKLCASCKKRKEAVKKK